MNTNLKSIDKEKRIGCFLVVLVFACLMLLPFSEASANPKIDLLKRKIADMQLLDNELDRQMSLAASLKARLAEQRLQLVNEILDLNRAFKLKSFKEATGKLRYKYDLELIRTLDAYIKLLDEKISFYQVGRDRVAFLLQLADDDIRMLTTLSDLRIDALTTQISLIINQYLPEAHTIIVKPEELQKPPAKIIWRQIALSK